MVQRPSCPLRKSQFNCLNFVINNTFRNVSDTSSQNVVGICLEVFNCVSAEQTVAMRKKIKFLKRITNSSNYSVRHLMLKPQTNWRRYKVLSY